MTTDQADQAILFCIALMRGHVKREDSISTMSLIEAIELTGSKDAPNPFKGLVTESFDELLAHFKKLQQVRVALEKFTYDIEATGGITRDRKNYPVPMIDEEWVDLGETYLKACAALGKTPLEVATGTEDDPLAEMSTVLAETQEAVKAAGMGPQPSPEAKKPWAPHTLTDDMREFLEGEIQSRLSYDDEPCTLSDAQEALKEMPDVELADICERPKEAFDRQAFDAEFATLLTIYGADTDVNEILEANT